MIIFVSALWGCQPTASSTQELTPVVYLDRLQVPTIKEDLNTAWEIARNWQQNAILHSINVVAAWEDQPQPAILRFDFRSENEINEILAVAFIKNSSVEDSVVTEVVDMTTARKDFREITPMDWALDANEAILIAHQNGGNDYINESPLGVRIELFLEYRKGFSNGPVVWRVEYLRPSGGGNFQVVIHALTGEVLAVIQ